VFVAGVVVALVWALFVAGVILNILLVPTLRAGERPSRALPLSVVIPARNEERGIADTLRAFLTQDYPELEIVVVDDRSTDGTAAAVRDAAAGDARVRLIAGAETPDGWLGKPWALEQGSREARGSLLLFVDADILYQPRAVSAMVAALDRLAVSGLTVFPRIELGGFWERVAMPQLGVVFFGVVPIWLSNLTTWPFLGIGAGAGNLFRRDAYEAIGRHEAMRNAVIDDIGIAQRARRFGFRTVTLRGNGLVSVRMYHGLREIVDGFTKNVYYAMGAHPAIASLLILLSATVQFAPLVGAAWAAWAWLLGKPLAGFQLASLAALALQTAGRVILFAALRYPLRHAILSHAPMAAVWLVIMLRSTWHAAVRRRIVWRGRAHDPRDTRSGGE
jgi:chlorobactene glucosyltransferase